MASIPIHLIFSLIVIGCGTTAIALVTRLLARRMQLDYERISTAGYLKIWIGIGFAGGLGQLVFQILQSQALHGLNIHYNLARLLAWLIVAGLVGAMTSSVTPYMERRRAIVVGLLGGLLGWFAFTTTLTTSGEEAARLLGTLALCATLPFAVLFPLPELAAVSVLPQARAAETRNCACGSPESVCLCCPRRKVGATILMPRLPAVGRQIAPGRRASPGRASLTGRPKR